MMINNNRDDKAANEIDLDIQGRYQTQSIYNTQQTLKQGTLQNDLKKQQQMQDFQQGKFQNENLRLEDQNNDQQFKQKPNSISMIAVPLKEIDLNKNYQVQMLQQKDKQQKMNYNSSNLEGKENQSKNVSIIKAEELESSQKYDQNQHLFSQEILDNENLLSQNRPLSPNNQSIDIKFQQYFGHKEIENNKNYNGGQLLSDNAELFSHRNDINQEEQKMLNFKPANSMNGYKSNQAIASQGSGAQKIMQEDQILDNRSITSTQNRRMRNYENQYFNIIMTQYNMCISIIVIFMNTFTFGIFWGLFFYEFRSVSHLQGIQESSDFTFIISSMSNLDYEDFFIYYRLIVDTILFFLVLVIVFGIPKQYLEVSKLILFYANFVITVFCFARMEKLLYYDDVMQLKAAMKKYNKYQASNADSFKSSFENYYLMLKLYIYSIVISVIIQMICFVYYSPNQEKLLNQIQQQQDLSASNNRNVDNNEDLSLKNPEKQSYILQNMLNSTVQVKNGIVELNIHPKWKQDVPSQGLNPIVE